jgi:FkbM family methyltransferase
MLIFDIGGNIGMFSEKCFIKYPESKIVIIEPNDNLLIEIKNRLQDKNYILKNNLVSTNSNEEIDFFISNANTISTASLDWINNSRFSENYTWNNLVKKTTINLDDLIKEHGNPDLIKIDVEGYELEVLMGLSEKQKDICFEWAEEQYEKINKSCEHLIKIGYKEFGFVYGDEYLKTPEKYSSWNECEIHKDINVLRKEKWGMIWVK